MIPGSPYYNPDQEYGRSLLDSPHKVVIAPTLMLPFGKGSGACKGGLADALLGGWSITPVVTLQSGFPIGISQNQPTQSFLFGNGIRPNIVPGQDFLVPGDITDRDHANTSDNLYLNKNAFATAPVNQFGNAPRILPGVYSPWRNNVDLGIAQERPHRRQHLGIGAHRSAEHVQHRPVGGDGEHRSSATRRSAKSRTQANNMRMVQFTLRFHLILGKTGKAGRQEGRNSGQGRYEGLS